MKHYNYDQSLKTLVYIIMHFPTSEIHFIPFKIGWEVDRGDVYLLVSQGFTNDSY